MRIRELRELCDRHPDDMHVVVRVAGDRAEPIAGIHVREYEQRAKRILLPDDVEAGGRRQRVLVLNLYCSSTCLANCKRASRESVV